MKKHVLALLAAITIPTLLTGCITTQVKGYTDPAYKSHQIKKAMVRTTRASFGFGELLEQSVVQKLEKKGVEAKGFMEEFPPTRQWSEESILNHIEADGYDSLIYVVLGGSDSDVRQIGYLNNGTISSFGNTSSFSSTSMPMMSFNRFTSTRVVIYDVKTRSMVWVGDTETSAGGAFYMGDSTTTNDLAYAVVRELIKSGHIEKK